MTGLREKVQITSKKNKVNQWIEIRCDAEIKEHLKHMIDSMKKEKTVFYLEEEELFIYNTIKLLPLCSYLTEKNDRKTIIRILKEAIRLQETCIHYLIPDECILFDLKHSFIDIQNESLDLLILPVETANDESLFQDWVLELLQFLEKHRLAQGEFLDKIFQLVKSSSFSSSSLKILLEREEKSENPSGSKANEEAPVHRFITGANELRIQEEANTKEEEAPHFSPPKKRPEAPNFERAVYPSVKPDPFLRKKAPEHREKKQIRAMKVELNSEVQGSRGRNEARSQKHKSQAKSERKKNISLLPILLYQAVMLIALGGILFYIIETYVNPKKMLAGIAIIWGLINYFVSKELLRQATKNREKNERLGWKEKTDKKKENTGNYRTPALLPEDEMQHEETELLRKKERNSLYLLDCDKNEAFALDKMINLIGRNYEEVDIFIDDKSVGRLHAIVSFENDRVYLQDNDSLNGSFLNEIKLNSNDKTELQVGDTISFALRKFRLVADL